MASLSNQIRQIYPEINFETDCLLQDDGNGAYIREWNYSEPQPTAQELAAVDEAAATAEALASVYEQRRRAYPTFEELNVALWEMIVEERPATANDLQAIREAVKQQYPKPD